METNNNKQQQQQQQKQPEIYLRKLYNRYVKNGYLL